VVAPTKPRVYLLDASIYIFRHYFALPDTFFNEQGQSVNAVYGYTRFLLNLLATVKPTFMAAAFDKSLETGFRHKLYPLYKANRALADDELAYQLDACERITRLLGIHSYASHVYEADDLIATLVRLVEKRDQVAVIMSHDKDLTQLVQGEHVMWDVANDRTITSKDVHEQFGVHAWQIPDYLALVGDAIDCIPGVDGIGPKTAAHLLSEFSDVVTLAENVHTLKTRTFRGKDALCDVLWRNPYQVMLSRELATVCDKADGVSHRHALSLNKANVKEVNAFFDEMNFGQALRKKFDYLVQGA
jgi:5'-3' exonuclease